MTVPHHLDLDRIFAAPEPWVALAAERERGRLAASPFGLHVLTFDAAFDVLRDRRFDTDAASLLDGAGIHDPGIRVLWLTALLGSAPADHDRLRAFVAPYFTRRAVTELRPFISALTTTLATPLAGVDEVDVVEALAARIPPAVFARMLGAPDADAGRIGRWSTTILQIFARRPELATTIETAITELLAYVDGLVDARRSAPGGDDMLSSLLAAEHEGGRLSTDELRALVLEALEASTDNTASTLATVLHAAAQHPEHWAMLRREPARIPGFVEEATRLWPRVVHIARSAWTDVEWQGVTLPAGAQVLVAVPSALRDPSMFPDPDRFDPGRDVAGSRNLNFGSGAHHCIGAALARMEVVAAVEVLAERWAAIEPAGAPVISANVGVMTIEHLPLRITAA